MAAFANTTMIRCLDLNDDYFGKDGPHPSDLIGAVLAAAETTHADGASFIASVAVAYEVLCTLVDAVGIRERGWDYVTYTSLAAALGAGKAFKLSRNSLRDCLSLAATANTTLGQTRLGELSMWKGMASANACRNGIFACLLAQAGVSGPYLSFEGKSGFAQQITGPLDLSRLGGFAFARGHRLSQELAGFLQRAGSCRCRHQAARESQSRGSQITGGRILPALDRARRHRPGKMGAEIARDRRS